MVTVFSVDRLGDKLGENQKRILEIVKDNPHITLAQLSKIIGISQTAIENNIQKLKEKGSLQRIGSAKGGHWVVIHSFLFTKFN